MTIDRMVGGWLMLLPSEVVVWKVKREGVRGGGEGGGGETGVWIMDELSCIGDTATTP